MTLADHLDLASHKKSDEPGSSDFFMADRILRNLHFCASSVFGAIKNAPLPVVG
jgi:hypothetical protein